MLKYFSYFPQNIGLTFHANRLLQIFFSGKNTCMINLSSAECVHSMLIKVFHLYVSVCELVYYRGKAVHLGIPSNSFSLHLSGLPLLMEKTCDTIIELFH